MWHWITQHPCFSARNQCSPEPDFCWAWIVLLIIDSSRSASSIETCRVSTNLLANNSNRPACHRISQSIHSGVTSEGARKHTQLSSDGNGREILWTSRFLGFEWWIIIPLSLYDNQYCFLFGIDQVRNCFEHLWTNWYMAKLRSECLIRTGFYLRKLVGLALTEGLAALLQKICSSIAKIWTNGFFLNPFLRRVESHRVFSGFELLQLKESKPFGKTVVWCRHCASSKVSFCVVATLWSARDVLNAWGSMRLRPFFPVVQWDGPLMWRLN